MTIQTLTNANKSIACRLHYKKVRVSANLPALSKLIASRKSPSILGGNIAKAEADHFSYWAAEPKEVFEFLSGQKDPFGKLQKAIVKYKLVENFENDLPEGIFRCGWIGYFSYDLARFIEPTARGVYTGSIGFIGIDGSVCLNIAIRTIIIADNKAFVQTGGGIVADSDLEAEWQETLTKAKALIAGINSVQQRQPLHVKS